MTTADRSVLEALADLVADRLQEREVPRRLLTRQEAADSLGISLDSFEVHCQPDLRVVRIGRRVLVPTKELDAWVEGRSALTLPRRG